MLSRAKKAIPGVVFSMLIAAPALAAGQANDAAPARKPPMTVQHRKTAKRTRTPSHSVVAQRGEPMRVIGFADDRMVPSALATAQGGWSKPGQWQQSGAATWYGGRQWQGRQTASGERFDENQMTAAHATLPMGSRVLVTMNGTGRSVVVTINDRPGSRKIAIDLSTAAARQLGILGQGSAGVTLTRL